MKTLTCCLIVVSMACSGCGGPEGVTVEGNVSLDGTPVDNGSITFTPVEGGADAKKGGATISAGQYSIPPKVGLEPGKYKVEIYWQKKTGRKVMDPDLEVRTDETREGMPPKFNSQTTLTAELESGTNQTDFILTTK